MSFSDYVANTFFESLYAEHIGGTPVEIPGIKTWFDKQGIMCRIVIAGKFADKDDVQARACLRKCQACHHWYVFDSGIFGLYNFGLVTVQAALSARANTDMVPEVA